MTTFPGPILLYLFIPDHSGPANHAVTTLSGHNASGLFSQSIFLHPLQHRVTANSRSCSGPMGAAVICISGCSCLEFLINHGDTRNAEK
jgi:hypothetical protein